MKMEASPASRLQPDWNQVWRDSRSRRRTVEARKANWNGRAISFAGHTRKSVYAVNFLHYLKPDSRWSVLDVGCGPGTLAVPLSGKVQSVTAIDISETMISILNKICREQRIGNVDARVLAWEDDWPAAGIRRHDVVIASRSLVVDDLEAAIRKLSAMARIRVVIASLVGDGPLDRRIFEAIGRNLDRGPDFLCVYNLLNQMGILADVTFLSGARQPKRFKTFGDALHGFDWMIADISEQEKKRLCEYLERHLVKHPDGWSLNYCHVARWAVMSWDTAD